jgi:bifunctional DNA-binding transcriptional regulator/antitoxin component of YhaV-PrlF toxin-antitoxin module
VNVFTLKTRKDLLRFTSRVDKKGRVLVSAQARKILNLRYGSGIFVKINGSAFTSKIDERGRFSVPISVRGTASFVYGEVGVILYDYG